jgi:dipeptidyl aminopeptidase/acylaminoacyl peptidase
MELRIMSRYRWMLSLWLAVLFCSRNVFAQQGQFTVEQVMSSPFPAELRASPKGGKIAWVFNDQGKRNLWIAGPPDYRGRQLTSYAEDDGQEFGEIEWTPDGVSILYVRGGDLEGDKEEPNPRSSPQGVEQDLWLLSLAGGQPRRLAQGHSPAVSPRGDLVAFIQNDQVWSAKIDGSEKPSQLIHAKGKAGSLRWSPDGSRLAFVSDRGDHRFIGVYGVADQSLRYLDPSADSDLEPVWSPDGNQVAFIRISASTKIFTFGAKREGQPWSIRVSDLASGAGRQIWIAREGKGSVFHGVEARNQLLWPAGNHLIFPWEGDGWTHLYEVAVQGGPAALLTPGDFEVEYVSLSPDRKEILVSSNQGDLDRRHIWRESIDGKKLGQVTSGDGIEWSPVMTSDGKTIALLRSDARKPARPAVLGGHEEIRDIAPESIPADFPSAEMVTPQPVIISAADGLPIHGQVFLPPKLQSGERRPAVIFFHGGSRRQMLLGWHYMDYYHNAYALNQYLASRGYIVLSVNYRSGTGYGMDFREALNYGATGASEFNDVLGAGLYLRSRGDVDPQRIGLWGGSYGGYLTALGLARASDLFAAGVDLHGVHDWNLEFPHFLPAEDPKQLENMARVAFESSPLAYVKTWRSPVLLIQGDDDRNVAFGQMVHLIEALRNQGVEYKQVVFPDEIHVFLLHASWLRAYHAASDFLDQHLRGK